MTKMLRMLPAVCLTFSIMTVFAPAFGQEQEKEHAAHHPNEKSTPAATAKPQTNADQAAATMQKMQDNMKKMQETMTKIQSSHDPAERRALLEEHQKAMQAQMKMMDTMSGGAMMMGMANKGTAMPREGKGSMMSEKGEMPCGDMMQGHQMMEQRMDMMQKMMEQMMQHEAAEHGTATAK